METPKYQPESIEPKWQAFWAEKSIFRKNYTEKKYYILDMFPYPSGDGLHVGHVENFTATDILARYKHLQGHNVLHPMGWDAFGLPAENFAIKTGVHPEEKTRESIANFKRQMYSVGLSFDWEREINTSSKEYYRWTQWMFLFLYKNGLAYRKQASVNWCPKDQTVLANEQVIEGNCDRCGTEVIQKNLKQWFFKITDFIEDTSNEEKTTTRGLLSGLEALDWPSSTLSAQKNWIGRSEGVEVGFFVVGTEEEVTVFTTRVDTLYGCSYIVLAPEHTLLEALQEKIENYQDIQAYIEITKRKTDLERSELGKDKTGVLLGGVSAVHPLTGEKVPIFVADYVLHTYGTGAVMGVPAHDERDFDFAKKYNLPIKTVVEECIVTEGNRDDAYRPDEPSEPRNAVATCVYDPKTERFMTISWKAFEMRGVVTGGIEGNESIEDCARREILEESGYKNVRFVGSPDIKKHTKFYHRGKKVNRHAAWNFAFFELLDEERQEMTEADKAQHEIVWVEKSKIKDYFSVAEARFAVELFLARESVDAFTEDGLLVNSGDFSGLTSSEARKKMTEWLVQEGLGRAKTQYRLRDWLISRQRYWGAPIPIIYCDVCGEVPVPESDLPVLLPTDVDFRPTGESPLVSSAMFHEVACPLCGKKARRESDTMDTFVCSSWYYLRFADPKNTEEFASKKALQELLPVDFYMGGAEHTVLHLLYARFFTKALHRYGILQFDEPFKTLRHQGMIIAEDGRKMSKSLGNVVNPDEMIAEFGADSMRVYEMFMGPLEDMKQWNTGSIVGPRRFLERVWKLHTRVTAKESSSSEDSILHKTIFKVTEDIEALKYNTAISALMIFSHTLDKQETIAKEVYEQFLILLSPFAPHLTEEVWQILGHKQSIFEMRWPVADSQKIIEESYTIVVQVNGKVRDQFSATGDITEENLIQKALASERVQSFIGEKTVKKTIVVPKKLISIVIG